jgi:hypothetical protein
MKVDAVVREIATLDIAMTEVKDRRQFLRDFFGGTRVDCCPGEIRASWAPPEWEIYF